MTNTQLVADIVQNISVQNVNKAFVYITDWASPLSQKRRKNGWQLYQRQLFAIPFFCVFTS